MIDWNSVNHAYGPADDLPELLQAAEESGVESGEAWDAVWSRLYHQGTVYPASFEALPSLAAMAERHQPAGYVSAVDLAAAILGATDRPEAQDDACERFAPEIQALHAIALRNLDAADSDGDFIYGLQAVMAFENGGMWQRNLNHLADGELPFDCPGCAEFMLLDLDGPTYTLTDFSDGSLTPTTVTAVEPVPGSVECRLLELAPTHSRSGLAEALIHVFGVAICPRCSFEFRVSDALI